MSFPQGGLGQQTKLFKGANLSTFQWEKRCRFDNEPAKEHETSNLSSTDQGMQKAECKQTSFFYISNTYDQFLEKNMPLSNSHFVYLGIYVFQISMG